MKYKRSVLKRIISILLVMACGMQLMLPAAAQNMGRTTGAKALGESTLGKSTLGESAHEGSTLGASTLGLSLRTSPLGAITYGYWTAKIWGSSREDLTSAQNADLGDIAGYVENNYPRYEARVYVNIPSPNKGYRLELEMDGGWAQSAGYFSADADGMTGGPVLGTADSAGNYKVTYTFKPEASGLTNITIALPLVVSRMYPGRELPITAKLYGDEAGTGEELYDTTELKARIRDYPDRRAIIGTSKSDPIKSAVVAGDGTTTPKARPDGSVGPTGMAFYIHKSGSLAGITNDTRWGNRTGLYNDSTLTFSADNPVIADLTKLRVGTDPYTSGSPITAEQLKNLVVTVGNATVVFNNTDESDPDFGKVTLTFTSSTLTSFNLQLKILNWNGTNSSGGALWPRSEIRATGSSGYTYLVMPANTDGVFTLQNGQTLYLNHNTLTTEPNRDVAVSTVNPNQADYIYYQTYTPPPSSSPTRLSITYPSYGDNNWWTDTADQPLFRLHLWSQDRAMYDTTFDITIPSTIQITHLALPAAETTFAGPLTLTHNGAAQTVDFPTANSFVELDTPISGADGTTITAHLPYLAGGDNAMGRSGGGIYSSTPYGYQDGIDFFGDVLTGTPAGNQLVQTIKNSVQTRFGSETADYSSGDPNAANYDSNIATNIVDFNIIAPIQVTSPGYTLYTDGSGVPGTSIIGSGATLLTDQTFWLRIYASGTNSYGEDGSWKEPVIYVSLPPGLTTVRRDYNFTGSDISFGSYSAHAGQLESVRTITGLIGANAVNGEGTVVELRFKDEEALTKWYDSTTLSYRNRRATGTTGTYSYPTAPYIYLRVRVKPDLGLFPNEGNNPLSLNVNTVLGGTTAPGRGGAEGSVQKSVLSNDTLTNADVTALQGAGGDPSDGDYLWNFNDIHNLYVRWAQTASASVGVDADGDGSYVSYIPGLTSPDNVPEMMRAGSTGNFQIQFRNNMNTGLGAGYIIFQLPQETMVDPWYCTIIDNMSADGPNTVDWDTYVMSIEYSLDGTNWSTDLSSLTGYISYVRVNFNGMPGGGVFSGIVPFTVPSVSEGGTGILYGLAVGVTSYDFGGGIESSDGPTAAIKLTVAQTVTFDTDGGSPVASQSVEYGGYAVRPAADPAKTGYTFVDWYKDAEKTILFDFTTEKITTDRTVYAKWAPKSYTMTFDYQGATGGNSEASRSVTYDQSYGVLPVPTKSGVDFGGWYTQPGGAGTKYTDNGTYTVDGDITLYAYWTAKNTEYTVYYYLDGTTTPIAKPKTGTGAIASTVTETAESIPGYTADAATKSLTLAASGNVIIFYYTANTDIEYTVHYYLRNTTTPIAKSKTVTGRTMAATVTETAPNIPGYTVVGSGSESLTLEATGNVIIFYYTANTYKVIFDSNGGSAPAVASTTVTYDQAYGAGTNGWPADPTRTGYTFTGWNMAADGTGTMITSASIVKTTVNHTLYAQWKINSYAVTYETGGGSPVSGQTVVYDTLITPKPSDPVRPGFDFGGWYTDEGYARAWDFDNDRMPAEDLTLYAKWTPKPPVFAPAPDRDLDIGASYTWLDEISAVEYEGGPSATDKVVITGIVDTIRGKAIPATTVLDTGVGGSYRVTYSVTNAQGLTETASRTIRVKKSASDGGSYPWIVAPDKVREIREHYGIMSGIEAWDIEDGNLTGSVKIIKVLFFGREIPVSQYKSTGAGFWTVTYEVTDSDGNTVEAVRSISQNSSDSESNGENTVQTDRTTSQPGSGGGGSNGGGGMKDDAAEGTDSGAAGGGTGDLTSNDDGTPIYGEEDDGNAPGSEAIPATGDDTPVSILVSVAVFSLVTLVIMTMSRSRRKRAKRLMPLMK